MRRFTPPYLARLLFQWSLVAALLFASFLPSLAAADDNFDVPAGTTDFSGLQAVTANSVDGVNLRAEPDASSDVLMSIPVGNVVDLRVDKVHTVTTSDDIRWWPVTIWGVDGWIAGMYLAADSESSSTPDATDSTTSTTTGKWAAGDYVAANTDNLAMRAGPGTDESRIAWLGKGDVVQIVDGPFLNGSSEWWLINDGSINAYVYGNYLTTASELDIAAPSADKPALTAGDAAEVAIGSGGANVREDADPSADVIATLNEGSVVAVVDGPSYDKAGDPWYLVKYSTEKRGFVSADLLVASTADTSDLTGAAASTDSNSGTSASSDTSTDTITYHYPLAKFRQTQGFGCTIYSFEPYNADLGCYFHNGLDLAAPLGTPLMAAANGTVKYAGWCDCGLGYYVEIDHGNGTSTITGHMNALYVTTGQTVSQGEVIGEVGSTGNSTGPHTHFMFKVGDSAVDPTPYMSS